MKIFAKGWDKGANYISPFFKRQLLKLTFIHIMRVSIFILFLFTSSLRQVFAKVSLGDNMRDGKLTVNLNEGRIVDVLNQQKSQRPLRFYYRNAEVRNLKTISLQPGRWIHQNLLESLEKTGFKFRLIHQNILLDKDDTLKRTPIRITGKVLDLNSKQPLAYATVELLRREDLQFVGKTVTDAAGNFEITTRNNSQLLIRVSLMGYQVYKSQVTKGKLVILPEIYLEPDPKVLQEISISARSPLVKQDVDRLVYNVQADPDNKTSTVLDILAKVPLMSVDADGNIKLKGNSNFKVLIDGRTSLLMVNGPEQIFRVMPASNIASIEVITTPPAKYDGEGLAGIINVITVKKKLDGYNGNLLSHYKAPNGPRNSATLTLKTGKFAVSTLAAYNINNQPQTSFSHYRENTDSQKATINQNGSAHTDNGKGLVVSQFSYEIDSLNQLAGSINYSAEGNDRISSILTKEAGVTSGEYQLDNNGHGTQRGYDLGIDYQKGFKGKKAQLFSISYRFGDNKNHQNNHLITTKQIANNGNDYYQDNRSGTKEQTIQLDYTHPLKHANIEAGIKAISRDHFSEYQTTSFNDGNSLKYRQNIYAIYNSYQFKLGSWSVKAGARLEMTALEANFSSGDAVHIPNYNRLFPSLALQKKVSKAVSFNLGYTQRISRPGINQLNPYVDRQNPLSISYGNPNLRPELNHTLSLNYSIYRKTAFNTGLSYSFSNNSIQYVSLLGADGINNNTPNNLGRSSTLSGYISVNYSPAKQISINANAEIQNIRRRAIIFNTEYARSALAGSSNISFNYTLPHEWRTGLEFLYYSPQITLQSTSSPYYYTSLSVAKSVFKKKLNIRATASNPYLRYMNYKIKYTDPQYSSLSQNDIVYRRFNIYLNYGFGKLREGVKRNRKTIYNDDKSNVAPPSSPNN
jgi:hypothetical protein